MMVNDIEGSHFYHLQRVDMDIHNYIFAYWNAVIFPPYCTGRRFIADPNPRD